MLIWKVDYFTLEKKVFNFKSCRQIKPPKKNLNIFQPLCNINDATILMRDLDII